MLAFPWDLNPSKPQGVDNLRRGLSFSGHPFFIPWVLTSKCLLLHASNDTRTWTVTVFKLRSERTFIDFSLKCKWELEDWCVVTEDPQLQLGNPDRTQMLQCFMLCANTNVPWWCQLYPQSDAIYFASMWHLLTLLCELTFKIGRRGLGPEISSYTQDWSKQWFLC